MIRWVSTSGGVVADVATRPFDDGLESARSALGAGSPHILWDAAAAVQDAAAAMTTYEEKRGGHRRP